VAAGGDLPLKLRSVLRLVAERGRMGIVLFVAAVPSSGCMPDLAIFSFAQDSL
jgi:hypothetical protein